MLERKNMEWQIASNRMGKRNKQINEFYQSMSSNEKECFVPSQTIPNFETPNSRKKSGMLLINHLFEEHLPAVMREERGKDGE